jgi:hypothetical protein
MPLAKQQRADAGAFADGIYDLMMQYDSPEAVAASLNIARILTIVANAHQNNEFSKS